jgi:hypothetical protein
MSVRENPENEPFVGLDEGGSIIAIIAKWPRA